MILKLNREQFNYACSIVTIKELNPIEGADKIRKTVVDGNIVVVGLDVKVGDKMLYFVSGTKLNPEYCKYNNLYTDETINRELVKGYISPKQSRVKVIKLKGVISDGILLPLKSLECWVSNAEMKLSKTDIKEFHEVEGKILCEKYIVPTNDYNTNNIKKSKAVKISRLVDEQFHLHVDTENLRKNIHKINPEDIIGIHYKKHGTSFVAGKILVKRPLKWYEKVMKKIGIKIQDTEYDLVYSSRRVVKNGFMNSSPQHYYSEDIWGIVAKELESKIPKGYTLYGEILGYTSDGAYIQKLYDYGCNQGEHKIYIYRITSVNEDGKVLELTDMQIKEFCERYNLNYSDTLYYYGYAKNLYSTDGCTDLNEWRDKLLSFLEFTFNEKDCYMCKNKVPEEGIVLRKENSVSYEAYKLKSKRFLLMESELQEKEETNIEDNQNV